MVTITRSSFAAAIVALAAPAAFAGGYTAPVEPVPPVVVLDDAQTVTPWGGAYVGGKIGAVFGADDVVGLETFSGGSSTRFDTDLTSLDISGSTYGLHAGYRWQRGNLVFGPELSFDLSNASARAETVVGSAYIESEMNNTISLRMKTGYIVRPNMMVYGSAGVVRGDFTYSSNIVAVTGLSAFPSYVTGADQSVDYSDTGYTLGLGLERKMSERMSITAEWNYNHFGRTDVLLGDTNAGVVTVATPSHHNISVGLNFNF